MLYYLIYHNGVYLGSYDTEEHYFNFPNGDSEFKSDLSDVIDLLYALTPTGIYASVDVWLRGVTIRPEY